MNNKWPVAGNWLWRLRRQKVQKVNNENNKHNENNEIINGAKSARKKNDGGACHMDKLRHSYAIALA